MIKKTIRTILATTLVMCAFTLLTGCIECPDTRYVTIKVEVPEMPPSPSHKYRASAECKQACHFGDMDREDDCRYECENTYITNWK